MIKVICVDASNKPSDIDKEDWIVQGEEYTIEKIYNNILHNQKSLELKEVKIKNKKYSGYHIRRFTSAESFGETLANKIEKEITIGELEYIEEGEMS